MHEIDVKNHKNYEIYLKESMFKHILLTGI